MKLVSMKMSKADADAKMEPSSLMTDRPMYPCGLNLNLDDDGLEKLGLTMDDFTVGKSMTLIATVDVTGCSMNERQGEDASTSISLQITDLCLEDGAAKATAAAATLYK